MNFTQDELDFLSAWAREEWNPACYHLPAHRLALEHGVSGAQLIVFIKAWTEAEGRKDRDILDVGSTSEPRWPWAETGEFGARFEEASGWRTRRRSTKTGSTVGRAT